MNTNHKTFARQTIATGLCALGALTALPQPAARAYGGDTHFVLTYYVARASGYTPEQALRIASADIGVDTSNGTEPVQRYRSVNDPVGAAQVRRDFHGFRDSMRFPNAAAADAFRSQIVLAFRDQELTAQGNPGVFLHCEQASYTNYSYWSATGHSAVGYTPDYLSAQPPALNQRMVADTVAILRRYANNTAGENFPLRPVDTPRVVEALSRLTSVNPPSPTVAPNIRNAARMLQTPDMLPHTDRYIPSYAIGYDFIATPHLSSDIYRGLFSATLSIQPGRYKIWEPVTVQVTQTPNLAGITLRGPLSAAISVFDPWFDNDANGGYRPYANVTLSTNRSQVGFTRFPVGACKVQFTGDSVNMLQNVTIQPGGNPITCALKWGMFRVQGGQNVVQAGQYSIGGLRASANIKKGYPNGAFNGSVTCPVNGKKMTFYFGGRNGYSNGVLLNGLNWDTFSASNCTIECGVGNFANGTFEVATDAQRHSKFRFTADSRAVSGPSSVHFASGWVPLPDGSIVSQAW